jgi:hypothetical protein
LGAGGSAAQPANATLRIITTIRPLNGFSIRLSGFARRRSRAQVTFLVFSSAVDGTWDRT